MERKIDTNAKEAERLQALIGDVKKALDDIQNVDPENAGDLLFKQFPKMSPVSQSISSQLGCNLYLEQQHYGRVHCCVRSTRSGICFPSR